MELLKSYQINQINLSNIYSRRTFLYAGISGNAPLPTFLSKIRMFIENTFEFKLQSQKIQVLKVLPALDYSFVLLVVIHPGSIEQLLHVDQNGKQLFQYRSTETINHITMMNDHTVAFPDIEESVILVINLQTKTIRKINHDFFSDCTAAVDIEYFLETHFLCLIERGDPSSNKLILTYYTEMGDNVVQRYQSKQEEFRNLDLISKGNNHSMIIWAPNNFDYQIVFWVFDLRDEEKRQPWKISVPNTIQSTSNRSLSCLINIWECTPGCYIIATNCNKDREIPQRANNTNLHYDSKTKILQRTKFWFQGADNQRLMEQQNFGDYSVFAVFQYQDRVAIQSPVYLVHNESETIAAHTTWKCESTFRFFVPSYQSSCLILAEYPVGDVKQMIVHVYKFVSQKETYLHLLLHINEDFDDDLLADTIDLLVAKK